MGERRYLIITKEDAETLAALLGAGYVDDAATRILERLHADTGGDIEQIARILKKLEACAASKIEAQPCSAQIDAQKLGRRLARLLERARGERPPGPALHFEVDRSVDLIRTQEIRGRWTEKK